MLRYCCLVICLSVICATDTLAEDIVIVVNKKNSVNKLSHDEVIDIFMGRNRQMLSGVTALPLDLPGAAPERKLFYSRITGKSMSEINAYWARLIFSGRASPPTLVRSQEEAAQIVMDNRSAVAYIDRSMVSSQIKVVFELNSQ